MHHIPELGAFLEEIISVFRLEVFSFTFRIPMEMPIRRSCWHASRSSANERSTNSLSVWDRIKRRLRPQDRYIRKTNQELLRRGIISQPLSDEEIWSITDIHDDDRGISLKEIARALTSRLTHVETASVRIFWKAGVRSSQGAACRGGQASCIG